jgi:transposase-like protein
MSTYHLEMNCPRCGKPMHRVAKRDKHIIRWRCVNPKCGQFLPIKEVR